MVRAVVRWNHLFLETRHRDTVFLLGSRGSVALLDLKATMKRLLFATDDGPSVASLIKSLSDRVRSGRVNSKRIVYSAVFVHKGPQGPGRAQGASRLAHLVAKLAQLSEELGVVAPKVLYFEDHDNDDADDDTTSSSSIISSSTSHHQHARHSSRVALARLAPMRLKQQQAELPWGVHAIE